MPLEAYLRTLDPDERPVAREWGSMHATEFQARIGPEVERLADRLGRTHRWYDLRVSDIAKIASGGGLGSVVAALIARFG
jgi:hypothetical protein